MKGGKDLGLMKWFDCLGGLVTVRIRGGYPEKILNQALSRGILVTQVRKEASGLTFSIRTTGLRSLTSIAEQADYEIDVVKKEGMPFAKKILTRRWMLFLGGAFFVASLYLLSSFVWAVEIRGTSRENPAAVKQSAARYGLSEGAWIEGFKKNVVEEGILRDFPLLSYAEVDMRGVKAIIKVVEKVVPEDMIGIPFHLVADREGIVDDVLVLDGQALVQRGSVVVPGDILISGLVYEPLTGSQTEDSGGETVQDPEPMIPKLVRARGTVRARVTYEGYGEYPLIREQLVLTGNKGEKITVRLGSAQWVIQRGKTRYGNTRESARIRMLAVPTGEMSVCRAVYREERMKTTEVSERTAERKAKQQALIRLKKQLRGVERVISTRVKVVSTPGDNLVRVKAAAEVIEDIGVPQPIRMEQ